MSVDESPTGWLRAVASVDDRPAVRQAAQHAVDEMDRLRAEVTELGGKVVALSRELDAVSAAGSAAITQLDEARSAPREHCESCYWSGDDEMCSPAR